MAAKDSDLMFRTTGTLTQSESMGPLTIHGTPPQGMSVEVIVPSAFGANDTVLPRLYMSDDGSTYTLTHTFIGGAQKPGTAGSIMHLPFFIPMGKKKYLKLELVVTIASTTANLGVAIAGLVLGMLGGEIDRTKNWTK